VNTKFYVENYIRRMEKIVFVSGTPNSLISLKSRDQGQFKYTFLPLCKTFLKDKIVTES